MPFLHSETLGDCIKTSFQALYNNKTVTDVTLVCDDQTQLAAHKIVLSAMSPIFKEMLQSNPDPNPVIHLTGVRQADILSILQLMYLGQVTLPQGRLNHFLEVARGLQIEEPTKGAIEREFVKEDLNNEIYTNVLKKTSRTYEKNAKHRDFEYVCDQCEYKANKLDKLKAHQASKHEGVRYACDQCEFYFTTRRHLKTHQQARHEGLRYSCDHCEYLAKYQYDLKRHTLSKHKGYRYPCDQCGHMVGNQKSLKNHIESKHKGICYSCEECGYEATTKGDLNRHRKTRHEGIIKNPSGKLADKKQNSQNIKKQNNKKTSRS